MATANKATIPLTNLKLFALTLHNDRLVYPTILINRLRQCFDGILPPNKLVQLILCNISRSLTDQILNTRISSIQLTLFKRNNATRVRNAFSINRY